MSITIIPTSVGGVALPGQLGQVTSGPLAALFGNSKSLETLNYPAELSTDATKMHYVQFYVKEIVPTSYTNTPAGVTNSGANLTSNAGNAVGNIVGKFIGAAAGSNIATGLATTPPVTQPKAVISLYMPDTINSTHSAKWSEVNMNDAMGSKLRTLRGIDSVAGDIVDSLKGGGFNMATAEKVWNSASSDPNVTKGLANALTSVAGASDDFASVLLQAHGYAVNPQLQMLYTGTDMRSFQLTFNFTPKSRGEAEIVNRILYNFKYYHAPRLAQGQTASNQSMFLIPPALFNVKFMYNGHENPNLPKYADCVLASLDINYAPNGFAAHTDGSPIQTQLTLQFNEIEIVEKSRLELGYYHTQDDKGLR